MRRFTIQALKVIFAPILFPLGAVIFLAHALNNGWDQAKEDYVGPGTSEWWRS